MEVEVKVDQGGRSNRRGNIVGATTCDHSRQPHTQVRTSLCYTRAKSERKAIVSSRQQNTVICDTDSDDLIVTLAMVKTWNVKDAT